MKKESDLKIISRLFSLYSKRNKGVVYACVATDILEGIGPYTVLILSSILIDGIVAGRSYKTLLTYLAIGMGINFLIYLGSAILRKYLNARLENSMERQNQDLNDASMEIDYEHLENQEVQEKKRKQEQVINVRGGIYWNLIWPLDRGFCGLIHTITAMIIVIPLFAGGNGNGIIGSIWMNLLMLAVIIGAIYGAYATENSYGKKGHKMFEKYADCKKIGDYIVKNILTVSERGKDLRIFGQEAFIDETIHKQDEEAFKYLKKDRSIYLSGTLINNILSNICMACVYIYVAINAYMGLISIGNVVLYASGIVKCIEGVSEILLGVSGFKRIANYGRDYLDYIDFKEKKYRGTIPVEKRRDNRFLVEFDNVSFKYPGSDEYVIKNLSLKLDIGERFAIVGKNGSGKTTFIKLLCRLYDVTEGTIKLNGIDITKYDYDEYLGLFSAVFQDYQILSLKAGENIAASEKVDHERVQEAISRAGLSERFESINDEVYVGKEYDESGINFSGGEKQKMAIARAIYKNAPFVIMDEPTAALDPLSECEVYAGFDKMVGNKTALYISHRLASCRFCKDILVFDRGNVIQRGTHEELEAQEGLYRRLWHAQAQYYES